MVLFTPVICARMSASSSHTLADMRTQITSVNSAIEAQRDFWLAQADLDQALIGKPNLAAMTATLSAPVAESGGH